MTYLLSISSIYCHRFVLNSLIDSLLFPQPNVAVNTLGRYDVCCSFTSWRSGNWPTLDHIQSSCFCPCLLSFYCMCIYRNSTTRTILMRRRNTEGKTFSEKIWNGLIHINNSSKRNFRGFWVPTLIEPITSWDVCIVTKRDSSNCNCRKIKLKLYFPLHYMCLNKITRFWEHKCFISN